MALPESLGVVTHTEPSTALCCAIRNFDTAFNNNDQRLNNTRSKKYLAAVLHQAIKLQYMYFSKPIVAKAYGYWVTVDGEGVKLTLPSTLILNLTELCPHVSNLKTLSPA